MAGPLVVIVGPTASGKSSLAMELARQFGGELICADSRTVYKGMDIGTAKPPVHDRKEIVHHLLDIIEPDEHFSAARFKELALEAIDDIESRGKLPVLVGGSGLYIDSLIFDFAFLPTVSGESREDLEKLSIAQLQDKLKEEGIPVPQNHQNRRHLIRAIETNGQIAVRKGLRADTFVIGLSRSREELRRRIEQRIETMVEDGLVDEAKELAEKYGWLAPGMLCPAYKALRGYIDSTDSLDDAKAQFARNDYQYAKRQMTWFRRNEHIRWVEQEDQAIKLVQDFLQQKWPEIGQLTL